MQDSSGRSEESSEGEIGNMQPFTSGVIPGPRNSGGPAGVGKANKAYDPNVEQVKKVLHGNPNANRFEEDQRQLA